jgi:ATP-dependent DNA helicase RecG
MRPEVLYPLFQPVTSLPGVGARIAKFLETLAGAEVHHLLWHLPSGIIDRRYSPKISEAISGRIATLAVQVDQHRKPPRKRMPYKVLCSDETGTLSLIFFHAHGDYLKKSLPEGETRIVSGKIEQFGQDIQITHPDHICTLEERDSLLAIEAVYPLTQGVSLKVLGKILRAALKLSPELPEWIDPSYLRQQNWPAWHAALMSAHEPEDEQALEPTSLARSRLAYDELLANQLALALVRANMRRLKGRPIKGDGLLSDKVLSALPYDLTTSQETALAEIKTDMAGSDRMLRLLQGDVGSGKTVVALLVILAAVEAGYQAAIMAPTEILARQHLETIEPLAEAAGLKVELLTGRHKGKARAAILERFSSGEVSIAIGTHALFQNDVEFQNLGLAVIDEQHRFGVHQRLTLAAKGSAVDMLVMTATPIPRTLMLTAYGYMEVSRLMEKPAGRKPIDTRVVPLERIDDVVDGVRRTLSDSSKVFWICPLVEESKVIDAAAAEERYDHLKQVFGDRAGLVHGRMKGPEKDAVMESFAHGNVDILVSTTVVEVGVNVPDATVMVIEHAERFGLAQLHQLRGRIGRGERASTCLLLYASPLTETAQARLKILRETNDGFVIAEEDLRLRGAGELLGTRQSGLPEFRLADLAVHGELLAAARDDAAIVLSRDPDLKTERGQTLRTLLYLFERDAAVKFLQSG